MRQTMNAQLTIGLLAAACASTPGADPHDMSAAQHQNSAREHQAVAKTHQAAYDPKSSKSTGECSRGSDFVDVCWTSTFNPTKHHLDEAERHRKHAADHRAASQALRAAEARSCAGIASDERDISPFAHTEDIASVERLGVPDLAGDSLADVERTVGAVIRFHAVPGMTAEWLQRVIDCHLARNAALGHSSPNMPDCPLVLRGVSAKVESSGRGFSVNVRADDRKTATEVLARATRLTREPGAAR